MLSFQVFVLGSTVGFLLPFLDSLPQLFLKCLPCAFAFGLSPSFPFSFVHFSSGSGYSAFVSSFPLSSRPCLTTACPVRHFHFRFFGLHCSSRPSFPCLLSQFFVLGFLFVSFRPSLIRSHSRSSSAYLVLSLSVFPLPFRFLSSTSFPVLATQLSAFSFLFLPRFASQLLFRVLPLCLSTSLLFHFRSTWFPMLHFRF